MDQLNDVWILTLDIDLGVSIEGVYDEPFVPTALAASLNKRDRVTWVGGDGNTYSSTDVWHVQHHKVVRSGS